MNSVHMGMYVYINIHIHIHTQHAHTHTHTHTRAHAHKCAGTQFQLFTYGDWPTIAPKEMPAH